jgi:uncharacterized membrane protein YgcG
MRTTLRAVWALVALAAALLMSGCGTMQTAAVRRPSLADYSIRVVKSSGNREVSSQELAQLRNEVIKFLESQQLAPQDSYYVEVNLPPDASGAPGETLVVQLANVSANSYRLVSAYAASQEDYPYYYYGYGYRSSYAPSFLYGYYDPFDYYYGGGSYPSTPPGGYVPRSHRPNDDHRAPDNDDHRTAGTNPHRPADGTHARPPGDNSHRPPPATVARHDNPPYRPRPEYASNGDSGSGRGHGGGAGSSPSSSSYSPPVSSSGGGSSSGGSSYSPPPHRDPEPAAAAGRDIIGPNTDPTVAK